MKKIVAAVFATMLVFGGSFPAFAAVSPSQLEEYLKEVQLSESEFEAYLASYDLTVEDFEDVEEIRSVLGPRVTEESLGQLLEDYGMSTEELESLLAEYGELEEGKSIVESFLFISDIEEIILLEEEWNELDEELMIEFEELYAELGITEEELANLSAHLDRVMEDPAALEKLESLSYRMLNFGEFETTDELTPEQIAELLAIADEFKQFAQLDFSFYLVRDGAKTPISFESLMAIEDVNGESLLVEVYDNNGQLLLDAVFTGETINSDLITETGETITEVTDEVVSSDQPASTVKGGQLPDTAGNYAGTFLFGASLLGAAYLLMRKVRAVKQ